MALEFKFNAESIILIILGILAILFPQVSTFTVGVATGFLLVFVALLLLITGYTIIRLHRLAGVLTIILAILSLFFSWVFIFSPDLVAVLTEYVVFVLGLILIIYGISVILTCRFFRPALIIGLLSILFGIAYVIIGEYLHNPIHLGIIVGLFLILAGINRMIGEDPRDYIDV